MERIVVGIHQQFTVPNQCVDFIHKRSDSIRIKVVVRGAEIDVKFYLVFLVRDLFPVLYME